MKRVFRCGPSFEDGRPLIDFDLITNAANDWLSIGKVLEGRMPVDRFPAPVRITVLDQHATQWDCFSDGGARGLFSRRFLVAVGRDALADFELMPAILNGEAYYFLRPVRALDCLDRAQSEVVPFPHDPARVMEIRHYVFRSDRLGTAPRLFCIPETPELLATEILAAQVVRSGLRGIRFEPTP